MMIDKDSPILPIFWDLSSSSEEKRIEAAETLLVALADFQNSFQERIGTEEWNKKVSALYKGTEKNLEAFEAVLQGDVKYSLIRLIKGLASPREGAREGFSLALTELLKLLSFLPVRELLALIQKHNSTKSTLKKDLRDVLLGKVFGLQAIASSRILTQSHVTLEDLKAVCALTFKIRKNKTLTTGACSNILTSIIEQVKKSSEMDALAQYIWDELLSTEIVFVEDLAPVLLLINKFPVLKEKVGDFTLLQTENFPKLVSILKNSRHEQFNSLPEAWDLLFKCFIKENSLSNILRQHFAQFWNQAVDRSLLDDSSNTSEKRLGLLVLRQILPSLNPSQLMVTITDNLCKCLFSPTTRANKQMSNCRSNTLKKLTEIISSQPNAAILFISRACAFFSQKRSKPDIAENTQKMITSLLSGMNEDNILETIKFLQKVFKGVELLEGASKKHSQEFAVLQMFKLLKLAKTKGSENVFREVLDFLVLHGLFLDTATSDSVSSEIRSLCLRQLYSVVVTVHYMPRLSTEQSKPPTKLNGTLSTGELWIEYILNLIDKYHKQPNLEFVSSLSSPIQQVFNQAQGFLNVLESSVDPTLDSEILGLKMLTLHAKFILYIEQDEEIGTALKDVQKGFELISGNPENEGEDLVPIDVIVDVLISFLSKPNIVLKEIVGTVFGLLNKQVTTSTIGLLLEVLGDDDNEVVSDNDEDEVDEEANMETFGLNSKDEEMEEANGDRVTNSQVDSEASDNSDEDEDEELEGEVDPDFLNRVKSALGSAAIPDDSDGEEADLDDEQMLQFDGPLSQIFKEQKKVKKKKNELKRELIDMRTHLLNWVGIFLDKNPTGPLLIELLSGLISLAIQYHREPKNRPLVPKVISLVQKKHRFDSKTSEELLALLTLVNRIMVVKSTPPEIQKMCATLNQAILLSVTTNTNYEAESNKELAKVYEKVVLRFFQKKDSGIKQDSLKNLFKVSPQLGLILAPNFIKFVNPFQPKPSQKYHITSELLLTLLGLSFSKDHHSKEALLNFLPEFQNALQETFQAATDNVALGKGAHKPFLNNHIKLLIRAACQMIERAKAANDNKSVQVITPKLHELVEKFSKTAPYSGNRGILDTVNRMFNLCLPENESKSASKDGKRKRKQKETQSKDKKPKVTV